LAGIGLAEPYGGLAVTRSLDGPFNIGGADIDCVYPEIIMPGEHHCRRTGAAAQVGNCRTGRKVHRGNRLVGQFLATRMENILCQLAYPVLLIES
jgi:hypothetical protein